jgi:ABC-type glycerol-3-phosphate transport system permease component
MGIQPSGLVVNHEIEAAKRARRTAMMDRVKRLAIHLVLIAGSLLFLLPFIWAVSTSLKPDSDVFVFPPQFIPDSPQWQNYPDALTAVPFGRYALNTLFLAAARIIGNILSCTLVAFAFARLRWKGRDVMFFIVLATMMIPEEVTLIPQYIIYAKIGWVNTYLPLTVPSFFAGSAFYIFLLRQFFMTIPRDLDEAARVDGASFFQVYWRIIMPLSTPALVTVGIFTFQNSWNAFFGPLIYLQDRSLYTVSLGLSLFQEQYYTDWTLLMAASVAIMLPTLIVFFLLQRRFIEGVTFTGLKG